MVRFFLIFISVILFRLGSWLFDTFGQSLTSEQIIFHLFTGSVGLAGTDMWIIKSFVKNLIFFSFVISAIVFAIVFGLGLSLKHTKIKHLVFFPPLALLFLLFQLDTFSYIRSFFGKDHFTLAYKNPTEISFINPSKKKNLILIYVESLENHLKNESVHGSNLISSLERTPGEEVADFWQAPGTGWTIAGLVASQCSVPLKAYQGIAKSEKFMPHILCMGDILSKFSYRQYFLVGPDLKFQGMDKLFGSHGYQYLYGRDQWKNEQISQSDFSSWGSGLSDDALFEQAIRTVKKAKSLGLPFNINILTSDSHAPQGWPSDSCRKGRPNIGYRETFRCAADLTTKFVEQLASLKVLENTVVVVMGDHLFHNDVSQTKLFSPPKRRVYFKIFNPEGRKIKRNEMTHFDVAPTIIDALGVLAKSHDQFGLGLSLYSEVSADKNTEGGLLTKVLSPNILNSSKTYNSFWLGASVQP